MFDKIFKTSFCCQNCNLTPSDIYIRFRYLFICKDRKKKVLCFLKYISITLNYNSISYFYAQCFIIYIKKKIQKFLATSGRLIKKNAYIFYNTKIVVKKFFWQTFESIFANEIPIFVSKTFKKIFYPKIYNHITSNNVLHV